MSCSYARAWFHAATCCSLPQGESRPLPVVRAAPWQQVMFNGAQLWRRHESREVYCKAFEIGKRAVRKSTLVRGAQHHTRGVASLKGFLPARGTEAPTVTWVQAWKAECGNCSRKIVAARF